MGLIIVRAMVHKREHQPLPLYMFLILSRVDASDAHHRRGRRRSNDLGISVRPLLVLSVTSHTHIYTSQYKPQQTYSAIWQTIYTPIWLHSLGVSYFSHQQRETLRTAGAILRKSVMNYLAWSHLVVRDGIKQTQCVPASWVWFGNDTVIVYLGTKYGGVIRFIAGNLLFANILGLVRRTRLGVAFSFNKHFNC